MALELHISRRAAREIERIVEWWAVNRPSAPGAVRKDLEAALGLLLVQPDIGSTVQEVGSPDVRRFHVDRIRYWVYYRVRRNRLEARRGGQVLVASIRAGISAELTQVFFIAD